jgi:hypothetical protein
LNSERKNSRRIAVEKNDRGIIVRRRLTWGRIKKNFQGKDSCEELSEELPFKQQ